MLSIIVPVYKAERYLGRCVDSILVQTFTNFELILVNDGSPDSSGELCEQFSAKDHRIKVFHKKNGGVSSARQLGLDNAIGEYVIHVDPDDFIEPTMLEELYSEALKENADMVICDYYKDHKGVSQYISQKPTALLPNIVMEEMLYKLHGACWNKLVKRECFVKYGIRFPMEFSLQEDLYVTLSLLKENIVIAHCPRALYHYTIGNNENSISNSYHYSENTFKEDIIKRNMFCQLMSGHPLSKDVRCLLSISMVARAYAADYFSSLEFMRRMHVYRGDVRSFKYLPIRTRFKLYASCIGLYGFLKLLSDLKKYCKHRNE